MDTLATMWASYADKVIPPQAADVQRLETKRAFYAGAHAILAASVTFAELMDEEEGHAALQSLADEVETFVESGGLS